MSEVARIIITPEQANKWLEKYKADVQRPVRQKWVSTLAQEMKEGKFDQNSTIQLRKWDGDTHLIDGRHRLHAVIESGISQSFYVVTDEVCSYHALLDSFRHVNEGKTVTNADYFSAMNLDLETGLSKVQLNRVSGAVPLIKDEFHISSPRYMELIQRTELIRYYGEAAGDYFEATAKATKAMQTPLKWAASIAVGLVTFDESAKVYGKEAVFAFWEGVARAINAYDGDPRGTAMKHLARTVPSRSNGKVSPGQEMRSVFYTARYIASCFNAWVEGRPLLRAVPDVTKPPLICGSRFRG